ncbi:MAG: class I SAM-dependent methyltransferase [Saprospiraceae bacterium]|nr:class I SAM-dependent methyltransferase [Saprospiraceae bacterium]
MKKHLKNIIPSYFRDLYAKISYKKFKSRFYGMSLEEVFDIIYKDNYWKNGESRSGPGSTLEETSGLIEQINRLIVDFQIKSILDLPCGDFNWMRYIDLNNIDYLGADIVSDLVELNIKKHADRNIKFIRLDLLEDQLPKCDLILVRDCLVHFSDDQIISALNNITRSGSEYLLTTTFTDLRLNRDNVTGDWRPLNLQIQPFSLPKPILVLKEKVTKGFAKESRGKTLALWKISDLPLLLGTM